MVQVKDIYQLKKDVKALQDSVPDIPEVDLTSYYTKSETDAKISTEIAELVDSAPETLNTLKELGNALGNDPNFATTVATQIGGKAEKVHTHTEYLTKPELDTNTKTLTGTLVSNISTIPYNVSNYSIKGKSVNTNGVIKSLGEDEGNKLKIHNELYIKNTPILSLDRLYNSGPFQSSNTKGEFQGRKNTVYICMNQQEMCNLTNYNELNDFNAQYILKFDAYVTSETAIDLLLCNNIQFSLNGVLKSSNTIDQYNKWITCEVRFTPEKNNKIGMYLTSRFAFGGITIDYDTFIFEKYPVLLPTIEYQLDEPLRSTIDGTVYDELINNKIIKRVDNSLNVLSKSIIKYIKPLAIKSFVGETRYKVVNSLETSMSITIPNTDYGIAKVNSNSIDGIYEDIKDMTSFTADKFLPLDRKGTNDTINMYVNKVDRIEATPCPNGMKFKYFIDIICITDIGSVTHFRGWGNSPFILKSTNEITSIESFYGCFAFTNQNIENETPALYNPNTPILGSNYLINAKTIKTTNLIDKLDTLIPPTCVTILVAFDDTDKSADGALVLRHGNNKLAMQLNGKMTINNKVIATEDSTIDTSNLITKAEFEAYKEEVNRLLEYRALKNHTHTSGDIEAPPADTYTEHTGIFVDINNSKKGYIKDVSIKGTTDLTVGYTSVTNPTNEYKIKLLTFKKDVN